MEVSLAAISACAPMVLLSYIADLVDLLAGRDSRFKALVLDCAVLDLSLHLGTADIPDWIMVEGGVTDISAESMKKLFEVSPIHHVKSVTSPVLLMHGDSDKRCALPLTLSFLAPPCHYSPSLHP